MRTTSAILVTCGLLAAAFATGCTGNAGASGDRKEDHARLEITGPSRTEYSGSCTVGDKEPEDVSGQVPESFTYNLNERPLDCEISSGGDLRVDLTVGENVHAVQRVSGGNLNLTYENGSVSSVVSSSSGSGGQVSSLSSRVISSVEKAGQESSDKTNDPGNVMSESRNVSGFDDVELEGVGNLSITRTGSESLSVEAEEDILPKLRAEVENNRLIIGRKPNTTIRTTEPINYELTVKDLDALEVSGSGNVDAERISTDELDAEVSGSGSVEYIGDPTVNQDVSGAGRVGKH